MAISIIGSLQKERARLQAELDRVDGFIAYIEDKFGTQLHNGQVSTMTRAKAMADAKGLTAGQKAWTPERRKKWSAYIKRHNPMATISARKKNHAWRKWTPERRAKFIATMKAKREAQA
jgi:hypothetical protein